VDEDVKKYADSVYENERMESARTLRDARVKALQLMAARNPGNLPISGIDIRAVIRLYVEHVERCTTARFESYEQAFVEAGRVASEQDLADIMKEFKAARVQEIGHSAGAISQFITSRGSTPAPVGSPKEHVDHGSAQGHDRVLERWKIWRAKVQLKSSPALAKEPDKPGGGSVELDDRRFALLAIEEALKSVPEDGRPHPRVGAIVVKDGNVLAKAHRGEKPKSHAEFVALEDKLSQDLVAGATVYTTLEPCTTRKHPKIPCAQRLIDRKVRRVVIGMLDPNPDIRGRGDQVLSEAGIEVQLFPRDLRAQVEEMNRDFIRAQKQRQTAVGSSEASHGNALTNATLESDPKEFWEQRKKLPETDLLRKIWSKPYWRIWIRPTEFKRARFKDVEQCRQFILSSEVRVEGWFAYPSFLADTLEVGNESISGEIEHSGRTVQRAERWNLFRSGQFVHNRGFDEIPQLGDLVHVLEILDTVTAVFEFADRMANFGVLSPKAAITFELHGVAGRSLTWPQDLLGDTDAVGRECWCQEESVSAERRVATDELKTRKRDLALEIVLELYTKFGWTELPMQKLESAQHSRFGTDEPFV
jgi:pyrimidine deaminase RibD-like protein